ncbi:patatin-like phospholipase family protein [Eremococcus coleocola]|uniref:Phospholipase, patatin family n=1 Tax=Eremococcus coleocola ACS-139-V-Col8 TaxID=908337 RepID=E4KRC7_9LACT|nr:patatin family protein [Eremococcus coleocola]EFR30522.1 phospholipase, patatin family [Eremococcus coleocola ACS-139-V-Col8]
MSEKIGMVLEGGGMRGLYTAGVLDQLIDLDLPLAGLVTVSAGALFGVNYLSKQKGRTLRYNKKYLGNSRYMSLANLLKTGNFVDKDFAYYDIPMKLDVFDEAAFEAAGVDFYVTVTNLASGQAEYIKIDNVFEQMEALRASSALPFLSRPVTYQDQAYLDGGIADSIPYQKAFDLGYDRLIIILTRDINYSKSPSRLTIGKWYYRHYPDFIQQLKNRANMYNQQVAAIKALEAEGKAFVIRPSQPLKMKRLEKDPQVIEAVYQLGVADMQDRLVSLREFIKVSD